ncbi:hypothetical protein CCY99_04235 [Helicobacter sp. 16-1353]|uniref:glycosyltransferase family 2 protein n=1 Tax=Helicobacter sp. 16-1353 TaxID=2004996 RepID=UPI000DCE23CC|nr:glycosyltransferase family A protein [Helicobacter sp. 16-1353]RAX54226.1 hypothetical protein CCY99_04235 [Helicobacter sp. 16-1353]
MANPKISIIIPIFNTQDYLARAIESCLNQTYLNPTLNPNPSGANQNDIEIILIDDKSTDSSLQIAKSFLGDERIKLIQNKTNLGTFLARAEGIKVASGEYILFLDSDDYLRSNALELLMNDDRLRGADIIHFGIENEPFKPHSTKPKIHTREIVGDEIANEIIIKSFKTSWLNLAGRIYKTELVKNALKKLDFIDSHLISSEDTMLFFIICLLAKRSVGISENLYIYCENMTSTTRSKDIEKLEKQISDRLHLIDLLEQLSNDKELSSHKYFSKARANITNMLNYFICYSKKFLNKDFNDTISPYLKYSFLSMKYIARWQTMAKILIYLCSSKKL